MTDTHGGEYQENEQKVDFPDFDKVYKRWTEKHIVKHPTQIRMYEAIANCWCVGKSVVDVGCGMGIGTNILGREALGAWGIDNNQENIDVAKAFYESPRIKFETYDLLSPPPRPTATFDVVVLIEVIEHIKDWDAAIEGLRKFGDRKRNTVYFISSPNRNNEALQKTSPRNEYHVREWTAGEFYEAMTKHFNSVVMYAANKLSTFDQSETVDGETTETPLLVKCEGLK